MIYGSVCSGIEAASVAWHPLGWRAAFYSEIEAFPRAVLRHHYPDVPLHGDFTTIQAGEYAAIDVLVGGTPCQSFSVAGLRGGLADDRGNLALEYLRLAQRLRPRWLVWENVPGVLSSNGGRDFGSILGGLGELGYGFAYRVLDAQYVRVDGYEWAVPQRRRRVFVVGHLGDWRRAAAVLFERESLRWDSPPRREARQGIAPTLSARTNGGGGLGTDFDLDGGLIAAETAPTLDANYGRLQGASGQDVNHGHSHLVALNDLGGVSHALTAKHSATGRYDPNGETFVAHSLRGGGFDASEDGTGRGTPLVPVAFQTRGSNLAIDKHVTGTIGSNADRASGGAPMIAFDTTQVTSKTNRSNPQIGVPCHTLAKGAMAPAIAFQARASADNSMNPSDVAPPLDVGKAGGISVGQGGMMVRRLTPMECERLQGFPDRYTAVPYRGKLAADGPRYKALGNSMACNVMRWIGMRMDAVERL